MQIHYDKLTLCPCELVALLGDGRPAGRLRIVAAQAEWHAGHPFDMRAWANLPALPPRHPMCGMTCADISLLMAMLAPQRWAAAAIIVLRHLLAQDAHRVVVPETADVARYIEPVLGILEGMRTWPPTMEPPVSVPRKPASDAEAARMESFAEATLATARAANRALYPAYAVEGTLAGCSIVGRQHLVLRGRGRLVVRVGRVVQAFHQYENSRAEETSLANHAARASQAAGEVDSPTAADATPAAHRAAKALVEQEAAHATFLRCKQNTAWHRRQYAEAAAAALDIRAARLFRSRTAFVDAILDSWESGSPDPAPTRTDAGPRDIRGTFSD